LARKTAITPGEAADMNTSVTSCAAVACVRLSMSACTSEVSS
jgi:hypothetical protein